jgi:hypothetical protein
MLTLYLMKDSQEGYHVGWAYLMKDSQKGYHVDFVPDEGLPVLHQVQSQHDSLLDCPSSGTKPT